MTDEPDDDGDAEPERIVVDDAHAGERLDAVIAALSPHSRSTVQRLIEDGRVSLGGLPVRKPGQRTRAGDVLELVVPPPVAIELVPEPIPITVLFEDADLIAVDKPAGLVVHPAPGHPRGTLVNALLHHCRDLGGIGGELRPGIVHRLDKDTSGVMVVAKTERAHAGLTAAFAAKSAGATTGVATGAATIVREYLGIAAPPPPAPSGTLRTFHNRHPTDRKRFSSRVTWGKTAVTHYETVEALPGAALLRFRLGTGRTHQIRVHAADHGWPLLGDPLYGRAPPALRAIAGQLGRQALHAARLDVDHPVTGERLHLEAPLPADLEQALASLTRSST